MSSTRRLSVGLNLVWLGAGAGGVGRYASELLAALSEREQDLRLVAFIGRDAPTALTAAPWAGRVEWVRLPVRLSGPPVHLAAQFVAVPALARRRGLDVVHSPANGGPAVAPGVATVITIHDLLWLHQGDLWDDRRAQRATRRIQLHSARRATRIIAISEAVGRDLPRSLGVAPERVDVVPQGVREGAWAEPTPESELRRRLGLGEARVVLCVAQKRPYKNLGALIRALSEMPDRDVRLVLPGAPTEHEDELRRLATSLGVEDRVHLVNWVSDADLEGLYALAACFVLPSLMEGFGLPVLEAMRRGVPVACSDRWALPEAAGDAALLFDPTDQAAVTAAVRRLLEDRKVASDLVARGRERARTFTWARTAEGTLATYRRAAEQRRRR